MPISIPTAKTPLRNATTLLRNGKPEREPGEQYGFDQKKRGWLSHFDITMGWACTLKRDTLMTIGSGRP